MHTSSLRRAKRRRRGVVLAVPALLATAGALAAGSPAGAASTADPAPTAHAGPANAAAGNPNVKALVYVDAAAPDVGETNGQLSGKTSALSGNPAPLFDSASYAGAPAGTVQYYLKEIIFLHNFASDLPARAAEELWATQRPAATAAFDTPSAAAAWKTIPSWVRDRDEGPDHHAAVGTRHGPPGALPHRAGARRFASDAHLPTGRGHQPDPRRRPIRPLTARLDHRRNRAWRRAWKQVATGVTLDRTRPSTQRSDSSHCSPSGPQKRFVSQQRSAVWPGTRACPA
jgi:hypothetical protein